MRVETELQKIRGDILALRHERAVRPGRAWEESGGEHPTEVAQLAHPTDRAEVGCTNSDMAGSQAELLHDDRAHSGYEEINLIMDGMNKLIEDRGGSHPQERTASFDAV